MFQELLKKIARELNKRSIPYMVIGGQAVLLYGEPRLTRDIDITLGVNVDKLDQILEIVMSLKLRILVENVREFVPKTMVLPAMEEESGIRVDFIFSFSSYEKQAIQRAREIRLGRTPVRFGALEDIVIHKVIAGRPRDIEDIKSMLLKNTDYDSEYIETWLKEFDSSLGENFLSLFRSVQREIESV